MSNKIFFDVNTHFGVESADVSDEAIQQLENKINAALKDFVFETIGGNYPSVHVTATAFHKDGEVFDILDSY